MWTLWSAEPWNVAVFGLPRSDTSIKCTQLRNETISLWLFACGWYGCRLVEIFLPKASGRCWSGTCHTRKAPGQVQQERTLLPQQKWTKMINHDQKMHTLPQFWASNSQRLLLTIFLLHHISWAQAQIRENSAGCINHLSSPSVGFQRLRCINKQRPTHFT